MKISLIPWTVLALVIFGNGVSAAAPSGTLRQCRATCRTEHQTCHDLAATRIVSLRATCTGTRSERTACRRRVAAIRRETGAQCRHLRTDCGACCRAGGNGPVCPVGQPVTFDPPPPQDLGGIGLPHMPDGSLFVLAIRDATLTIDVTLQTPVTALGACTGWITSCVDPAARSLDDCARSAPLCATERPWEEPDCCPPACFDAYQAARRAGTEPLAAFGAVYFEDGSCMPGLRALLDGTAQ